VYRREGPNVDADGEEGRRGGPKSNSVPLSYISTPSCTSPNVFGGGKEKLERREKEEKRLHGSRAAEMHEHCLRQRINLPLSSIYKTKSCAMHGTFTKTNRLHVFVPP
jgi:hypothetical protein